MSLLSGSVGVLEFSKVDLGVLGKGEVISAPTYLVQTAYGEPGKTPHILNRGI